MALIGDRDRDHAAARLKQHYLRGRLSLEELTERLEVALTARRDRDVRVALSGLPGFGLRTGLDEAWRAALRATTIEDLLLGVLRDVPGPTLEKGARWIEHASRQPVRG